MSASDQDERGVALYIALPMALLMIASAWSTIGMGEAVWARQRGQETADASAMAAAITHAQGMNYVAMLNAGMLAMTIVYLVARVLIDAMNLMLGVGVRGGLGIGAQPHEDLSLRRFVGSSVVGMDIGLLGYPSSDTLSLPETLTCFPGSPTAQPYCYDRRITNVCTVRQLAANALGLEIPVCEISRAVATTFWLTTGSIELGTSRRGLMPRYEKAVLRDAFQQIHQLEQKLAQLTPAAASAVAMRFGHRWDDKLAKFSTYAVSASMMSADTWEKTAHAPAGLPLEFDHADKLCDKAGGSMGDAIIDTLGATPGLGGLKRGKLGAIVRKGIASLTGAMRYRYCSDDVLRYNTAPAGADSMGDVWRASDGDIPAGPARVDRALSNGHAAFSVYALSEVQLQGQMLDRTMRNFRLARLGRFTATSDEQEGTPRYLARAEYYFDCSTGEDGKRQWESDSCNRDDGALYAGRWRARLRQVKGDGALDLLISRLPIKLVQDGINAWLDQMAH